MRGIRLSVALAAITSGVVLAGPVAAQEGGEVSEEVMNEGEGQFLVNCRQCHGTTGSAGVPLKSNGKLADASYLARTILVGPGYMTSFAEHLDDQTIAAIATYVRNSWGNDFGPVTPEEVAAER